MIDLREAILELVRITSTDLPGSIEKKLQAARDAEEPGSAARNALDTILKNVSLTRQNSTPICQDTGTPLFFVQYPEQFNPVTLRFQIRDAIENATRLSYLRPNAVEPLGGKNTGNNLGDDHFPGIHFAPTQENTLIIDLILKGGGCENVGAQYSLPDTHLHAGRDLEGVRKVVLDAVYRAQGEGCSPGFLGVSIGGDRGSGYLASKEVLLRPTGFSNPVSALGALEEQITRESNELGIGPMGFGGKTTILDTSISTTHRLPASFFVTVSYMCWAFRKRRMIVTVDQVQYE